MVLGEIVRESEREREKRIFERDERFFPRGLLSSFEREARERERL